MKANKMRELQDGLEMSASLVHDYVRDERSSKKITRWADCVADLTEKIEACKEKVELLKAAMKEDPSIPKAKLSMAEGELEELVAEREPYLSCLLLKYWDRCKWLYDETKTSGRYTYEEMPMVILERIMYAMQYANRWRELDPETGKPKTNAMACIHQAINTEKLNILGYSSDAHHSANTPINKISADLSYSADSSTPLVDTFSTEDDRTDLENSLTIKRAADAGKVIEAVVMAAALTDDCRRHIIEKKSVDIVVGEDEETGDLVTESHEVKVERTEFWARKVVNLVSEQAEKEWFRELLISKYDMTEKIVDAALQRIKTANRRDLYEFVESARKLAVRAA